MYIPGWLPPGPSSRADQGGPRMAAWWVKYPELHQILLTIPTDKTVKSHYVTSEFVQDVVWEGKCACSWCQEAGSASEDTLLIPRQPSLTGRLACVHWMSVRSQLVMRWIACLKSASNFVKEVWEADGEHRSSCSTLGALKDDLRRIRASWELMSVCQLL